MCLLYYLNFGANPQVLLSFLRDFLLNPPGDEKQNDNYY
jgi:hypothetical protein